MDCQSMSQAVGICLDRYPMDHEFGLWDFKQDVFRIFPQSEYNHGDTVSRRLREHRHGENYQIICIKPAKARYKKVAVKTADQAYSEYVKKLEEQKKNVEPLPQSGWLF